MPYANYDDVGSICAVYNHCLEGDEDMDFFEFIGEKILAFGFAEGEEKESDGPAHPRSPVHPNAVVQIQNGVLFRQVAETLVVCPLKAPREKIVATNILILSQEFHPGIFHPPAA